MNRPRDHEIGGAGGRGYVASLDGLRGLAVMAVLLSHLTPEDRFPGELVHFGRLGVVAFFALSGYLITGILIDLRDRLRSGRITWGRAFGSFYARRALRILPAYGLALAVCGLVGYAPVVSNLLWFLTYTVNFGQALFDVRVGFADHFWSLAVEEQFYLVWPAIVLATPSGRLRRTILLLALGAFALNLAFALRGASFLVSFRLPFLGSLIPLCLGALLAEGMAREGSGGPVERTVLRLFFGVGLPLFAATQFLWFRQAARGSVFYLGFVDVAFSLASAALLVALLKARSGGWVERAFSWGPLAGIGKISYGIYVGHRLLMPVYLEWFGRRGLVELAAVSAASIALAALSWFFFEKPILDLKRFFPYDPSRSPGRG